MADSSNKLFIYQNLQAQSVQFIFVRIQLRQYHFLAIFYIAWRSKINQNMFNRQQYELVYYSKLQMVLLDFGRDLVRQIKSIRESYVPVNHKPPQQPKQAQQLRSNIYITLVNPLKIQYYFWLWVLYSFYAVLKTIVFIPFELIVGSFNSLLSIFHICLSKHITFFSVMALVVCYMFQQDEYTLLDPSFMYHLFRGQSTLKLYGLIFAIEVSQKICTMIGKYLYTNMKTKLENLGVQPYTLIPEMLACFAYTVVHAYFIFLEFNIYMVVINGSMQNFIIFCFVTNLTKMKSTAFKKFDSKSYLSQINFDAKDRLQKLLYLILFQVSQWNRHIPDIQVKLFFVYFIGAIIEHIKHITVLIQCGQIGEIDKIRNTMFYKMYVSTDDRTFMKCLNNDFTVIPFTVFFVKMVGLILHVNYSINNAVILDCYSKICFILVSIKIFMIIVRKINILDSPTIPIMPSVQSLRDVDAAQSKKVVKKTSILKTEEQEPGKKKRQ